MGKIAGDRDIPVIDNSTAHRLEALGQLNFPVGLGVVFISGKERAGAKGNAQEAIRAGAQVRCHLCQAPKRACDKPGSHRGRRTFQELPSLHG